MRKILHGFIGLIALTGALLLSVSTCFAAEELRIAGKLVEAYNAGDLADFSHVNVGSGGTFKYDFQNKTLTMKRVTITMTTSDPAISSNIKGLKIVVLASNTLQTESSIVMKLEDETEIKTEASSEGTLNIKSTSGVGIYVKKEVKIRDITLNIEGSQGIAGKTDATRVRLTNLTGKITGSEAAINEIKELRLSRTYFSSPANATFDAKEKHAVVNEEKKFVKELTLAPSLGFSIAGVAITRDNYDKMDKIPGVTVLDGGYLTIDPNQDIEHQSLKMKNVEINGGQHPAISVSFNSTLEVAGNNKLSSDGTVLDVNAIFLFKGIDKEATLELTSKNDAAIFALWLGIENLHIKATGMKGIVGSDENWAVLSITSADLEIKAKTEAISNFKDVSLYGSCTFMPLTYQFDEEKHGVIAESGAIANEVNIQSQTPFKFYIGGHYIGSANYKILSSIPGVTVGANGEFSYNPEKSVLTMRDVTIDNGKREGSAIYIDEPDMGKPNLTMELFGTNKITSIGGIEFYSKQNLMTGTGSLTIEAEKHAIHLNDALTVENITLDLRSKTQYAISKEFSDAKKIFIKDAKVFFKGKYESPVYGVEPILTNCEIVYPEGAKWDGNLFKAANGSDLVAGDVVRIASHLTGVALTPTLTLTKGTKMQLVHQLVPRNAIEETNVSWSTSDENIVSVTPEGKIECKEIGTAKITVQTDLGGHTATCEVTVTDPAGVEDAVFANIVVAPNPFGNALRIVNGKLRGTYALLNAQGVVVRCGNMDSNEVVVETSDLTSGLYLLRLSAENGATKTIRVVKDR